MSNRTQSQQEVQDENAALRGRLAELEETLRAIRQHEVDAFVMARPGGSEIVTLSGSDYPDRMLVESMSEGAVTLIRDGTIFYCNPCFAEMVATPVAQLVGTRFADWFPPEEQTVLEALRHQAGPAAVRAELLLLTAGGAPMPVQLSIRRLQSGKLDGDSIVITDVRERKQAEAALAGSERRFRALVEKSTDLIALLAADGTVLYTSPVVEQMVGGAPEDWLGGNFMTRVHPDDALQVSDLIRQLLALPGGSLSSEFRYRRRDGAWRWLAATATNLLADPAVGAIVANVRDMTARRQMETAEHEQRVLAEALRDTAAALNATLDLDTLLGRILENAARVVTYESGSIMLIEGDRVRITSGRGYTPRGMGAAGLGHSFQISEVRNIRAMLDTGQPLIISDVGAYPGWIVVPGTEWLRAFAGAPIRVKSQIIGFITLNSGTLGFFTAADAGRLQVFADQAGSALENARLLAETRQRLGELEAVAQVSAALRSAETVDTLLPVLIDATLAILGLHLGAVWLVDPAGGDLYAAVARGWTGGLPRVRPGESPLGQTFASGQTYIAREYKADTAATESMRALPDGLGGANIPLRTPSGIIGVLSVGTRLPREITPSDERLLTTVADIAGTAIHRLQLFEQTGRRLQRLSALRAVDQAIGSSFDLNVTLQIVLDQAVSQLGVDAAVVRLRRPSTGSLDYAAGRGRHASAAERASLRLGQGFAGRAVLDRRTLALPDLSLETPDPARAAALSAEGFQAYYGAPLIAKGVVQGVLEIFNCAPLRPDADWLDFLEALSGQTAIAIDNGQLFNELQRSHLDLSLAYDATIEGWSRALDLRDKETEGHTLRVTDMALRLARAFGLRDEELVHLRRGALLHDIGKMGVPDRILLKPGPLTDDEWVIMRLHPVFAHEMLAPSHYLQPALDIPYCHHEKWDGTGYPRQLTGESIPLAARIFAVVDVWDALRSDRPYRPAWPEAKVRQHLRALSGAQFDSQVLTVFEALLAAEDNRSVGDDTPAAHRPAILIVDDERNVLHSLERSLRAAFTVFTAISGAEALAILTREKIAVIISDQRMPLMTGLQLLQQARVLSPATRGLLVSAYSDSAALAGTLQLSNVRGYLAKPWQLDELTQEIGAAAAEYSMLLRDQRLNMGSLTDGA